MFAFRGVHRFGELSAFAFRRMGTLVTLGDPREDLPLLRAVRLYSSADDYE